MSTRYKHVSVIVPAVIVLSISTALAGELPPEVEHFRASRPSVLVPGCTTPVLEEDPPGYFVSTLVTRYFDDEKLADLRGELDLTARQQFLRFLSAGRNSDSGRMFEVRGFRNVAMWWEGDSLHGLYFVPLDGTGPFEPEAAATPEPVEVREASSAELLLEARSLRKQREFQSARNTLARLRKEFPMSPEARRALRELYFVNTADSRVRSVDDGDR